MNWTYYDVYLDGAFWKRVHYFGYLQVLQAEMKDRNFVAGTKKSFL